MTRTAFTSEWFKFVEMIKTRAAPDKTVSGETSRALAEEGDPADAGRPALTERGSLISLRRRWGHRFVALPWCALPDERIGAHQHGIRRRHQPGTVLGRVNPRKH